MAELDTLLADDDFIAWTKTAAIIDEKRPRHPERAVPIRGVSTELIPRQFC